ncbi:MAG: hypothetical protein IE909_10885 [Campylobacterales bacterium]|nr:hypothetical protein [Campylobacterales bacterium]
MMNSKQLNFVLPLFLEALDTTFSKSTQKELEEFLKSSSISKWIICSDYALGDKQKKNDVMTFSLIPYAADINEFQTIIKKLSPNDLKKTSAINDDFIKFQKELPIFHISFILNRKRKIEFTNEKEFFKYKTKEAIELLEHWCITTLEHKETYQKQIKDLEALLTELDKKSTNLKVLRDIEIVAVVVAYVMTKMCEAIDIDVLSWFSDRDTLLSYGGDKFSSPLIFTLIRNYFYIMNTQKPHTPKLAFGVPQKEGAMWYDEITKLPDFICGVLADYDLSQNLSTHSKFIKLLEDHIASNDKMKIFKLSFEKEGFRASKIEIIRGEK